MQSGGVTCCQSKTCPWCPSAGVIPSKPQYIWAHPDSAKHFWCVLQFFSDEEPVCDAPCNVWPHEHLELGSCFYKFDQWKWPPLLAGVPQIHPVRTPVLHCPTGCSHSTSSDPHCCWDPVNFAGYPSPGERAWPSYSAWEAQMNTRASLQSFLAGSDLEEMEGKKKFENTLSPFRAVSWKSVCLPALAV